MNSFDSTLLLSAELSDILPLAAFLVCAGTIVLFLLKSSVILRVQADDVIRHSTITNYSAQVPRLQLIPVHIPFTFRLMDTGSNPFEEVRIVISSHIKYTLQAFWTLSIRELHMSLSRTWDELRDQTQLSTIVNSMHCQKLATNMRLQNPHDEKVIILKTKDPLLLGAPPRSVYPLVVFIIREPESNELVSPEDAVILVNVIHLRDAGCPLPTSILAQYLKQAGGQLTCLKQLYLTAGEPILTENGYHNQTASSILLAEPVACTNNTESLLCSDSTSQDRSGIEQLCVVCHYFPLSRALLPCRHTCICAICFSKLDRCPMCRSAITSYFCIKTEDYVASNVTKRNKPKVTIHWLDAMYNRLANFLGFR
ncbi:cell growth regulator with RING finger domain protein 1-like isoform X2 [Sabethes cyaneus]|uniref:cell growth regulator with RING finger domain protein 1-like isoform X2 n=1 Tax=Sabethes cyaneus TaxID=53552 RepID=UPI00237DA1DD|nr:cell growth regulator with RING finger domain protein 1-like isoform X2 [Sabethes cyaneus]